MKWILNKYTLLFHFQFCSLAESITNIDTWCSILKIKAKLTDFACLTSSMSCSLSACLMYCSFLGVHLTLLNENEQLLLSEICCKCPSPAVTVKKLKCKGGRLDKRRLLCSVSPAASSAGSNRIGHRPKNTFTRFFKFNPFAGINLQLWSFYSHVFLFVKLKNYSLYLL